MTMPIYTRRRLKTDAEIAALYDSLRDSEAVAFQSGCNATTVLKIVREQGLGHLIPRRGLGSKGRRKALLLADEEIVRRYRAGENGPELAVAAGTQPGRIYEVLERHGVPRRAATDHGRAARSKRVKGLSDG
jgi:hypothetical protein